jgi:hypothetical protein
VLVKSDAKSSKISFGTSGPVGPIPDKINITNCDAVYHLSQNGKYTLNADYQCGTVAGSNCSKTIKVTIQGPTGCTFNGTYNAPYTQPFTQDGNYTITYTAYCGTEVCATCTFSLVIDKECCTGSHWITKKYATVNLDYSSAAPAPLLGLLDAPIGLKPVINAPKAVNVLLDFACPPGCCTATFKILQKNISVTPNQTIVNTIITGTIASIYTYGIKTRVWITPMCNGKPCGQPVIFDVKCNGSVCPKFFPLAQK